MSGSEDRPLKPGQRHPTEQEKKLTAREQEARLRLLREELMDWSNRRYVSGSKRPPSPRFCSGGLPSLGKRR